MIPGTVETGELSAMNSSCVAVPVGGRSSLSVGVSLAVRVLSSSCSRSKKHTEPGVKTACRVSLAMSSTWLP